MRYHWISNPLVRIIIPLMIGISSAEVYVASPHILVLFSLLFLGSYFLFDQLYSHNQIMHMLIQTLAFIILGNMVAAGHDTSKVFVHDKELMYTGSVESKVVGDKYTRYIIKNTLTLENNNDSFISILYVKNNQTIPIKSDDLISFRAHFKQIKGGSRVKSFDFKKYWGNKRIYYQAFTSPEYVHIINHAQPKLIENIRSYITSIIKKGLPSEQGRGIAKALLLGDKTSIDPDIKQIYREAGAMHVLAVSGLHVGIVFLLFNLPVVGLRKLLSKKLIWMGLVVLIPIWIFALICNLTPSVTRASMMISLLVLGQCLHNKYTSSNVLMVVAFAILLMKPFLLYDVGFQFSFGAVLGIILCYRPINNLYVSRHYLIRKMWNMVAITLSAQVFLFPLLLYYFHQFPIYFIPNSLVSVFAAYLILFAGIGMIIFSFNDALLQYFGLATDSLIQGLNGILDTMTSLPMTLIEHVWINSTMLIVLLVVVATFSIWLNTKKIIFLRVSVTFLLLFSGYYTYDKMYDRSKDHLVVYDNKGEAMVGIYKNKRGVVFSDKEYSDYIYANMHSYLDIQNKKSFTSSTMFKDSLTYINNGLLVTKGMRIIRLSRRNENMCLYLKDLEFDYLIVDKHVKPENLLTLLSNNIVENAIIFCGREIRNLQVKNIIYACEEGWSGIL